MHGSIFFRINMLSGQRKFRELWFGWHCIKWLLLDREYVLYLFSVRQREREIF